jgi:hypothetical protein
MVRVQSRQPACGDSSRTSEEGYVFITTALLMAVILGMTGLAFDIGRMYVARSEAQTSADALALKAASLLNGTQAGVESAKRALAENPNRFHFSTEPFEDAELSFSHSAEGPWEANPIETRSLRFARVLMKAPVPIYLLRVTGAAGVGNTSAAAVAGHMPRNRFGAGVAPFAPVAPNPQDSGDFGFERGKSYALAWERGKLASGPGRVADRGGIVTGASCNGDLDAPLRPAGDSTGYIGPVAAELARRAVLSDVYPESFSIKVGEPPPPEAGAAISLDAQAKLLMQRVQSDADPSSTSFAQYQSARDGTGRRVGNGRRLVGVPVRSGGEKSAIVGFRGFFLLTPEWYAGAPNALCAEYIGSWTLGSTTGGIRPSGSYALRLVQ